MTTSKKEPSTAPPLTPAASASPSGDQPDARLASSRANCFSIFRGWCWLLVCLSLLAAVQQLAGKLGGTTTASDISGAPQAAPTAANRFVVDVNQAPLHELQALPDVGAALAARIVDYRQAQGPFRELDDLLHVHGVGQRTLQQLRPMLVVTATDY